MFIKLDQGLTNPFTTTVGVKQGCSISPLIFNLFIDKLPTVYDETCDGLVLGNKKLNCLMWADDCVVFALSQQGLQIAINKTVDFFEANGLSVNKKKTKCMIFNKRGLRPQFFPNVKFFINNQPLENAETYTYLVLVFVPSGSTTAATKEQTEHGSPSSDIKCHQCHTLTGTVGTALCKCQGMKHTSWDFVKLF